MTHRRAQSGFTLLEMLIATTIVALIASLGFESLRYAGRVWSRTVNLAVTRESIDTVRRVLSDRLTLAYPAHGGPGTPFANSAQVWFEGRGSELRFLTHASTDRIDRPWRELKLQLQTLRGDTVLTLAERTLPTLTTPEEGSQDWQEETLLRNVRSLDIEYFKAANDRLGAGQWLTRWSGETDLPQLVKMVVVPRDATIPRIELLVKPSVTSDLTCDFDLISRRCR